jgi:hypothetical protein
MKDFIQRIAYPTEFETLFAKERAESNRGKNLSRLGKRVYNWIRAKASSHNHNIFPI